MNPPGTHCDSSLGKAEADSLEHARQLDAVDPLRRFRDEFLIPSKADLVDPHPEAKPLSRQNGNPLPSHPPSSPPPQRIVLTSKTPATRARTCAVTRWARSRGARGRWWPTN